MDDHIESMARDELDKLLGDPVYILLDTLLDIADNTYYPFHGEDAVAMHELAQEALGEYLMAINR